MNISIPLNNAETYILNNLFQSGLSSLFQPHFSTQSLFKECVAAGINGNEAEEAFHCLMDRGYLSGSFVMGSSVPPSVQMTDVGFDEACQLFVADYDQAKEAVATHLTQITEREDAAIKVIAEKLEKPFLIVHHFVTFFVHLGWVKMHREGSEFAYMTYISPLVKRALEPEV